MNKAIVAMVAALLATAATGVSSASAARLREMTEPYTGPAYAVSISTPLPSSTLGGYCDPGISEPPSRGCVRFPVKKGDRYVSFRIDDLTTLPVLGVAVDSHGRVLGLFCGATEQPFRLAPDAAHVDVWAVVGNCPEVPQPSLPTTGTITASFSRRGQ
ncbi:MAG: hypothetical protein M3134_09280 [Actinomycetota bacterium]|nr:hypothetical protein [Actinomycetota bacterium]